MKVRLLALAATAALLFSACADDEPSSSPTGPVVTPPELPVRYIRLTRNADEEIDPAFAPDGRHLAYVSRGPEDTTLRWMNLSTLVPVSLVRRPGPRHPTVPLGSQGIIFEDEAFPQPRALYLFCFGTDDVVCLEDSADVAITGGLGNDRNPSISRDGKRLIWDSDRAGGNVSHRNLFSMTITTLDPFVPVTCCDQRTSGDFRDTQPALSADGAWVVFTSDRGGTPQIWKMRWNGTEVSQLTDMGEECGRATWSPDGARIAFESRTAAGEWDIWIVAVDGTGTPDRITEPGAEDRAPAWSALPNNWIAFQSDRLGLPDLWLAADIPDSLGR